GKWVAREVVEFHDAPPSAAGSALYADASTVAPASPTSTDRRPSRGVITNTVISRRLRRRRWSTTTAALWSPPGHVLSAISLIPSPALVSPTDRAATGGRGETGHPAQDPRCSPGHHRHGAVRPAHRGPRGHRGGARRPVVRRAILFLHVFAGQPPTCAAPPPRGQRRRGSPPRRSTVNWQVDSVDLMALPTSNLEIARW